QYLTRLREILTWVGVSDCKMEEGSLRCDANISIRPRGTEPLGTKVEIKNMNSFKSVQRAIAHEIERQTAVLREGGHLIQETRGWDEDKQTTHPMRSKEQAHDYRYFPEPDLLPLTLSAEWVETLRRSLPELPTARRSRFIEQYGIPAYDAGVLTSNGAEADYFEAVCQPYRNAKEVSNWLMGDFRRLSQDHEQRPPAAALARMLSMIDEGVINKKIAKSVLEEMFKTGDDPDKVVDSRGWRQVSGADDLRPIVTAVLEEYANVVADYRGGKEKSFGFLVGQVMKRTGGRAAPADVNRMLKEMLG
ncbi:MAG TPA: Asp-tRNA(Asn)/Glu-tRNA(Gln) amidotransferase subunit GatB, partial [Candidatus Xenobia bacterium]